MFYKRNGHRTRMTNNRTHHRYLMPNIPKYETANKITFVKKSRICGFLA